jgi:hypothetical protein
MSKDFLHSEQKMDAAVFVDRAREMAAALEDREALATRSRPIARQRVAHLSGVAASLLHSLRYRPPKQIAADVFERLCAAMERKAAEQIRTLENEILAVRARRNGASCCDIRKAEDAAAYARSLLKKGTQC